MKKSTIAVVAATITGSAVTLSAGAVASASERVRATLPAVGQDGQAMKNSAIVEAYDTVTAQTRAEGRVLTETVKRKFFHVSRVVTIEAGTVLHHYKDGWYCTKRDNYYRGGGGFGAICMADTDNDGAFDKARMKGKKKLGMGGMSMLKRTIEPQVAWGEVQARDETKAVGLRKAIMFRGLENGMLRADYIEWVRSKTDPTVSRDVSVELPDGQGLARLGPVTIMVERATPYKLEYRVVHSEL